MQNISKAYLQQSDLEHFFGLTLWGILVLKFLKSVPFNLEYTK